MSQLPPPPASSQPPSPPAYPLNLEPNLKGNRVEIATVLAFFPLAGICFSFVGQYLCLSAIHLLINVIDCELLALSLVFPNLWRERGR